MSKKLDFSANKKRLAKAASDSRYRYKRRQLKWLEAQGFSIEDYEDPPESIETLDFAKLWARAKAKCQWCGEKLLLDEAEQDHLTPISKGGSSAPDNIVLCCSNCNLHKASKHPARFAAEQKAKGISTLLVEYYLDKFKNNPGIQQILSEDFIKNPSEE